MLRGARNDSSDIMQEQELSNDKTSIISQTVQQRESERANKREQGEIEIDLDNFLLSDNILKDVDDPHNTIFQHIYQGINFYGDCIRELEWS